MENLKKKIILCILPLLLVGNPASADLLCIRKINKVKNGKVNLAKLLQTTTESSCPKRFVPVLDTSVFKGDTGAQGATGAQGPKGQLNLESCIYEVASFSPCAEGNACANTLQCGDANATNGSENNDYMIHYDWAVDNFSAYVVEADPILVTDGVSSYPTGITIRTTSEEGYGAHTPLIGITCCLPD